MTDEILNCPFCGEESKLEHSEPSTARFNEGAIHWKVSCPSVVGEFVSSCIGSYINRWECTPEDAVEKWNKRK